VALTIGRATNQQRFEAWQDSAAGQIEPLSGDMIAPRAAGRRSGSWISVMIYSSSYNSVMSKPRKKPSFPRADEDLLTRFAGPSETVAASVPRALAAAIRAKVGKREFSRFVGRALARELVDQNRAAYVACFEKDHGPVDAQLTARLEALFAR
jgi:hypothetical protein